MVKVIDRDSRLQEENVAEVVSVTLRQGFSSLSRALLHLIVVNYPVVI